ncbi:hypothetical protein Trydic_g12843 [Trypoxylus dichotomus]
MSSVNLALVAVIQFTILIGTESCQRVILNGANGVSYQEKQQILDMHNSLRQAVALGQVNRQPPAANMQEMQWDEELARRAQKWSMSCYSEDHDPNRNSARFVVGQNIATFWTTKKPTTAIETTPEFEKALNGWFDEVSNFNYGRITGYGGTGHYTQLVWADTYLVGCGFAFYYDPSKGYTKNYICNYGPSGNVLTKYPYVKGYPLCSRYGLDYSTKWKGLCVKSTKNTATEFFNFIG